MPIVGTSSSREGFDSKPSSASIKQLALGGGGNRIALAIRILPLPNRRLDVDNGGGQKSDQMFQSCTAVGRPSLERNISQGISEGRRACGRGDYRLPARPGQPAFRRSSGTSASAAACHASIGPTLLDWRSCASSACGDQLGSAVAARIGRARRKVQPERRW